MARSDPGQPAGHPLREVQAVGLNPLSQSLVGADQEQESAAPGEGTQGASHGLSVRIAESAVDHGRAGGQPGHGHQRIGGADRVRHQDQGGERLSPGAPAL